MPHALAEFIQNQADARGWRNRDLERASGLSRQVTSKYLLDKRDRIRRLPEAETLRGFAKAFGVPLELLISKAIESLGLGYTSGDFVNEVHTASDGDLVDEIARRLATARASLLDPAAGTGGLLTAVTDETLRDPERLKQWMAEPDDNLATAALDDDAQPPGAPEDE